MILLLNTTKQPGLARGLSLRDTAMVEKRTFSDQELREMAESRFILARDAIRRGDKEAAEKMLQAIQNESMDVHDLLRDWLTDILSEIGRQFGDEKLHEIMTKTVGNYMNPLKELFGEGVRRCVETTATIWRAHFSEFDITEDDEKITFMLKPCGSGGRQIRDGRYGAPLNLLRIQKPQAMTIQSRDCPVYCAHCVAMSEWMLEQNTECVFVVEIEHGKDDANHLFHIYKDPSKVPEEIYTKLGREKP